NRRLDLELLDNKSPDLWPIVTGSETAKAGDDIALTHLPPGETTATGKACWSDQPPQERIAIDYFVLPREWSRQMPSTKSGKCCLQN
ncbi:hypothetical protein ACCS95_35325, partial [Rhizobium ruizarguesonis]